MRERAPHHARHTSTRRRGASAFAAAALLFLGPAACSQIAGLDGLDFNPTGKPCTGAAECDDMNPCTDESCSKEGFCTSKPTADGPLGAQTAGDCKTAACSAGQVTNTNDDTDIPEDHEDCTIDSCNAGKPSNTAKPDGTMCMLSGTSGFCIFGKCTVKCGPTTPCDDGNPCTDDTCDMATMQCAFTAKPDGTPTPGAVDVPGDCKKHACIGGVDTNAGYDPDIPITPNTDCDQELCMSGVPSNPPQMAGVACKTAGGKVCDGNGKCVKCVVDSDCSGVITDCAHPACTSNTCGTGFTAADTPIAKQTAGDCKVVVCDGSGGTKSNIDNMDVPVDGDACTTDTCTNGVPSNPNAPAGTACGNGQMCDANGLCACTNNMQCVPPQTCGGSGLPGVCGCTKTTCGALMVTCGAASDACGGMLSCDNGIKDGAETDVDCGAVAGCATKCGLGKKCSVGANCASGFCADGVCCDAACNGLCQACSAADKGGGMDGKCGNIAIGTDPHGQCADQGAATCGQNGLCDGNGACQKYASGTVCVAASCALGTLNKADTCNGIGTCIDNGMLSCGLYACKGAACGLSCMVDTDCAANAYCSGMGMCVAKQPNGAACAASNACQSSFCVDGVCCNTACNNICVACNLMGMVGTCGNVPAGQSDDTCIAPKVCDGMGLCN